MSSIKHLNMAVASILRNISHLENIPQGIASLSKDFVTVMAIMRVWKGSNPYLTEVYDAVGKKHPELLKELELYVEEGTKENERLPRI